MSLGRRDLLLGAPRAALASSLVASAASASPASAAGEATARPGPICFFSKFLPKLAPRALGTAVKQAGFAGVDLTLRPGGHVVPAEVKTALPAAVEALRAEGLQVPLVTTELLSAADPTAQPILATAGKLGVTMFKPGYFKYAYEDVRRELRDAAAQTRKLTALAQRSKIKLAFHNHGDCLGGAIWDVMPIVDALDPRAAGYYLDTRHVFAEGGQSSWKTITHLIAARTIAVAVKDFHWEKTAKGWTIRKVPLGEGMVDLVGIFEILAAKKWAGPISLHLEYPVPGGEDAVLAAAERDRKVLETALAAAYGPG